MKYWLIKSEPFKYSWEQFCTDKKTNWDGVRNYAARNNLRAMKKGDLCLFYHSNEGMCIVGIAKVTKEHFPDPTANEGDWSSVEVRPWKKLNEPVTLATIKNDPVLSKMEMIRLNRLSVTQVKQEEFDRILLLGKVK